MDKEQLEKIKEIFSQYPQVKLVYLFGSQARKNIGPLSDYDFAMYLDEKNSIKMYDLQYIILAKLSRLLKTDQIDIVILNLTNKPALKYNIITEGILILEKEYFKTLIEPRILNEYFDFRDSLIRHNLTKAGAHD
ncbi:nucleotidyltransferase [bacterium CG_4_10_14_0_2_um_filter_33_32]|nr:MAG: hypothetical protein AUJ93_03500 [bacterium CG2_30_33_46]PIR67928.1 MAG: nucleotidyltransferase [bacterium CG10_big_fil_rev_8_21_14_0_10_33_18]PIU76863.1 MAG: nucleotidyltransferase [bacterium CG06_land_8_20_14_3_00_33_50]PIW80851.1 MAG: nucleotidyltransferase [bacterium CG_4_8_14_3_um_filter_33_28]PIY85382.1 MAG: nucleotidyltransferase [bacterium CG_4_10_14_0_8_um_filter_33_57]PIZ86325.1 MAG: nucleotidyltransferase [bacterium CG_4_10_14_0_2_um_filter_33_32]PJA72171.1 MAG: nucleotidyl